MKCFKCSIVSHLASIDVPRCQSNLNLRIVCLCVLISNNVWMIPRQGGCAEEISAWNAKILAELNDDVALYSQFVRRAAADRPMQASAEKSLALSLSQRGEFLFLFAKRPSEALPDLDQAAEYYRRFTAGPPKDADKEERASLARVMLFRGLVLSNLKRSTDAIKSFSEAIELYEPLTVQQKMETLEPQLAWAYMERAKTLPPDASASKKVVQDCDRAIEIYTKWSKQEGYESFKEEVQKLKAMREKASKL